MHEITLIREWQRLQSLQQAICLTRLSICPSIRDTDIVGHILLVQQITRPAIDGQNHEIRCFILRLTPRNVDLFFVSFRQGIKWAQLRLLDSTRRNISQFRYGVIRYQGSTRQERGSVFRADVTRCSQRCRPFLLISLSSSARTGSALGSWICPCIALSFATDTAHSYGKSFFRTSFSSYTSKSNRINLHRS